VFRKVQFTIRYCKRVAGLLLGYWTASLSRNPNKNQQLIYSCHERGEKKTSRSTLGTTLRRYL